MCDGKLICPECGKTVHKCEWCGSDFASEDFIICVDGKHHFCSSDCFLEWLKDKFEEEHTVVETYVEEVFE